MKKYQKKKKQNQNTLGCKGFNEEKTSLKFFNKLLHLLLGFFPYILSIYIYIFQCLCFWQNNKSI